MAAKALIGYDCTKKTKLHSNMEEFSIIVNNGIDRLSSLPDTLLLKILSLIPFKTAVTTSILSPKWRHLWTHLPHLIFQYIEPSENLIKYYSKPNSTKQGQQTLQNYFSTVAHILHKLSTTTSLETLDIHSVFQHPLAKYDVRICSEFFNSFIPLVCAKNPINFKVCAQFGGGSSLFVPFPTCIFECKSLVHLELVGKFFCKLPESGVVTLVNLKKLVLKGTHLYPPLLETLVNSCPVLETLSLSLYFVKDEVVNVSSPSLKSLIISMDRASPLAKFFIEAPLLEHIALHNYIAHYSFVKHPNLLNKVYVSFDESVFSERAYATYVRKILRGISSVKSIHLVNNLAIFDTIKRNANVWSNFDNLNHLSLDVSKEYVGSSSSIPPCFLCKIKIIELKIKEGEYYDAEGELVIDCDTDLVKYILRKSIALDLLHVSCFPDSDDIDDTEVSQIQLCKEYEFCRKLFKMERGSLNCKIVFHGAYINASSDGSQRGSVVTDIDWFRPHRRRKLRNNDDDDDDDEDEDDYEYGYGFGYDDDDEDEDNDNDFW